MKHLTYETSQMAISLFKIKCANWVFRSVLACWFFSPAWPAGSPALYRSAC